MPQPANTPPASKDLAARVAIAYAAGAPAARVELVSALLQPLGTLAFVAVASGAFARFLPSGAVQRLRITPELLSGISAEHVRQLARYVEQQSPDTLVSLLDRLAPESKALPSATSPGARALLSLGAPIQL